MRSSLVHFTIYTVLAASYHENMNASSNDQIKPSTFSNKENMKSKKAIIGHGDTIKPQGRGGLHMTSA